MKLTFLGLATAVVGAIAHHTSLHTTPAQPISTIEATIPPPDNFMAGCAGRGSSCSYKNCCPGLVCERHSGGNPHLSRRYCNRRRNAADSIESTEPVSEPEPAADLEARHHDPNHDGDWIEELEDDIFSILPEQINDIQWQALHQAAPTPPPGATPTSIEYPSPTERVFGEGCAAIADNCLDAKCCAGTVCAHYNGMAICINYPRLARSEDPSVEGNEAGDAQVSDAFSTVYQFNEQHTPVSADDASNTDPAGSARCIGKGHSCKWGGYCCANTVCAHWGHDARCIDYPKKKSLTRSVKSHADIADEQVNADVDTAPVVEDEVDEVDEPVHAHIFRAQVCATINQDCTRRRCCADHKPAIQCFRDGRCHKKPKKV